MIVGIDEAGRGPLVGAVVACALCLNQEPPFKVKDSKALSPHLRQDFFSKFRLDAFTEIPVKRDQDDEDRQGGKCDKGCYQVGRKPFFIFEFQQSFQKQS